MAPRGDGVKVAVCADSDEYEESSNLVGGELSGRYEWYEEALRALVEVREVWVVEDAEVVAEVHCEG